MIKVHWPIGLEVVCDKSISKPAPKPVTAPSSGEPSAAHRSVKIRNSEIPPPKILNWLITDSCNTNINKKMGNVANNLRANIYGVGDSEGVA